MANSESYYLTDDEINGILRQPKFLYGDLQWAERPNNSAFLSAVGNLLDENGATIPALTVSFFYRRGRIVDDCKYTFTVFLLRANKRLRVYQLEVVSRDKVSHVEEGCKWFGPHQHFGEKAIPLDSNIKLCCPDFESWFEIFFEDR